MSALTEHVPAARHFLDPDTLRIGERIIVYPSARAGVVESIDWTRPAMMVTLVFDGSADRETYYLSGIRAKRPCPSCDGFLASGAVAGCCQTCSNDVESDLELVEEGVDHRNAAYLAAEELLDITTKLDPAHEVRLGIDPGVLIEIHLIAAASSWADAKALATRLGLAVHTDRVPDYEDSCGWTRHEWTGTRHGFKVELLWIDTTTGGGS